MNLGVISVCGKRESFLCTLLYVQEREASHLLLLWQREHIAILLWEVQLQETESPGFIFSRVHYKWLWLTDVLSVQQWMSTLCPGSPSPSCLLSIVRAKPGHTSLIAYFGRHLSGREARRSSIQWLRCSLMHQDILIISATLMGKKVNKRVEKKEMRYKYSCQSSLLKWLNLSLK